MGERSAEVEAYVAGAPEFARPILERIRDAFHAGCPDLVERMKWGIPAFEYKGMLGGMAFFKKHVAFGFWKGRVMADPAHLFDGGPRASTMNVKVASLADLPPKKVLVAYVREAKRLNDEGVKDPVRARPRGSIEVKVPDDLASALARNSRARKTFEAFTAGQRRDYVEWLEEARRPETRAKRLETTIEWLGEGKTRNWKYERC